MQPEETGTAWKEINREEATALMCKFHGWDSCILPESNKYETNGTQIRFNAEIQQPKGKIYFSKNSTI